MSDNSLNQNKIDIAHAAEDAFRKEGLQVRIRQGFGDRIEGRVVAENLAISVVTNLLMTNVKRVLRKRGVYCYGLCEERSDGGADFTIYFSNSGRNVRVGLAMSIDF